MTQTTIYSARRIRTMNPSNPVASHVAVRSGRIVGVGSLDELKTIGPFVLDDRFADKVLMPGFVEAHCHVSEGAFWRYVYCGYFDRQDPDGKVWAGLKSLDAVVARLRARADEPGDASGPIFGWCFDPLYFGSECCVRADLDRASASRPVGMLHASGHIMNVNTPALRAAGLLREGIRHDGIPLGADGLPTGEMKGPEAVGLVSPHVGFDRNVLSADEQAVRAFSRQCVRNGVTTATDLAAPLPPEAVEMLLRVTGQADFPTRIVALRRFGASTPAELIETAVALRGRATDQLRLGAVKIHVDGSIQGFSARLREPGYHNGAPNGLWYTTPEHLEEALSRALQHGVLVHLHTNGDEATELVLDKLELALRRHPSPDHRFTLQHCQLADAAQFRRMKRLGLCVNLFANHLYYWGEQHYSQTVGPERARRMNACATALREGVPMSIHSDAPVTPLGPLFTAQCAMLRETPTGRVLGEHERIGMQEALHAITLGAAFTLKLDGEIGSIEAGKRADFAVLEQDPMELAGERPGDIAVWGVVQGGRVFAAD
ncbi:amidohydrolase [Arvimicrobium flavum]|uniref:amidohydrolase n=1 Tax=Arvimicrobium flavum TaxID=3393320 RepID=UPI00237B663F|nr:amidohydrolase [Mesorhizobium shangrilense]